MSTTYVTVQCGATPLPHVTAGSAVVIIPQRTGVTAVPPAPLPETLFGSTVQTSYST